MSEEILTGGQSASQVVLIDGIVHRTPSLNAAFSHKILIALAERNFIHAPRFLGIDEQGREMLSYLDGEVASQKLSNQQLVETTKIIKQFHDAMAESGLTGEEETICHNDLAPWNLIINHDKPVAFIDFDEAAPGNRIDDVAYFLWTFLDLGSDQGAQVQIGQIKLVCDAYPQINRLKLKQAVLNQQQKILAKRRAMAINSSKPEIRVFSAHAINRIQSAIKWIEENGDKIFE